MKTLEQIRRQNTEIKHSGGCWSVWLKVHQQSFQVGGVTFDSRREAVWYRGQLAKAIFALQKQ